MIRKGIAAFLATAFITASALMSTTAPSLAGHYYGHYGGGYIYHAPKCFWKKVKVYDPYYGHYIWRQIWYCGG